jgi:hypothetical protein
MVEEFFGWAKVVAGLRKAKLRGKEKVGRLFTLAAAAYNLGQDEKSDGRDCVKRKKCGLLQAERSRRRAAGNGERVFLEAGESKKQTKGPFLVNARERGLFQQAIKVALHGLLFHTNVLEATRCLRSALS